MNIINEIVVFKPSTEESEFQVVLDNQNETFWASEQDIAKLFKRDRTVISKHIKNIFKEEELNKKAVCANFAHTASDGKSYQVTHYNLDVIISIGYRVKSTIATEFRIWANKIIKDHLIKGYSVNEQRLKQLKKTIQLINRVAKSTSIGNNSDDFIELLNDYTKALDILDDYDHQILIKNIISQKVLFHIDYDEAIEAILSIEGKIWCFKLIWK